MIVPILKAVFSLMKLCARQYILLILFVLGIFVLILGLSEPNVLLAAPGSNFSFIGGVPNSCSGSGFFSIPVIAYVTNTDSSQGSLTIRGLGTVSGASNNPNATISGFFIYNFSLSTSYSVAPHTPIEVTITVYSAINFTGSAITRSITFDCTTGAIVPSFTGGVHRCGITDGRLNCWPEMEAQPFAVYCEAGDVVIYSIDKQGVGTLAFRVTKKELDALDPKPAKNTKITEGIDVALYRLSSGELQVNGRGDTFFIWKVCT